VDLVDTTEAMAASAPISRNALAKLHHEQWHALARTAAWLVGDRQRGEELAQDAFVRLIEHWPSIQDKAAVPAWLYRTAVNLSRSSNRRRAIGRQKRDLVTVSATLVDRSGEKFGDALIDGPLGAAILALPRRQRECLVLRFVQDLSVQQIAATLEIGAGSVKTHLHRALTKLQTVEGLRPNE